MRRPDVIGVLEGPKSSPRRPAVRLNARSGADGVEVRHIRLTKRPDFSGIGLLVAVSADAVAAADCAVRHRIPLMIASDDELDTLVDHLDELSVTSHTMLAVRIDGRGERLAVADCTIEPEGPGLLHVEQDRATAVRRKIVLATADPLRLRQPQPFRDPTVELTIDHDDRGATRLPPRTSVIVRPARPGTRLIVNCDVGNYRGIAHDITVHATDRLSLARRPNP